MEHEGSLPPSQEPASGPYPEPDESSPHTHSHPVSLVLFSHLFLVLLRSLTPLYASLIFPMHATCPVHFVLREETNNEAPHYAIICSLLLLTLSLSLSLMSKYFLQHFAVKRPQSVFVL